MENIKQTMNRKNLLMGLYNAKMVTWMKKREKGDIGCMWDSYIRKKLSKRSM